MAREPKAEYYKADREAAIDMMIAGMKGMGFAEAKEKMAAGFHMLPYEAEVSMYELFGGVPEDVRYNRDFNRRQAELAMHNLQVGKLLAEKYPEQVTAMLYKDPKKLRILVGEIVDASNMPDQYYQEQFGGKPGQLSKLPPFVYPYEKDPSSTFYSRATMNQGDFDRNIEDKVAKAYEDFRKSDPLEGVVSDEEFIDFILSRDVISLPVIQDPRSHFQRGNDELRESVLREEEQRKFLEENFPNVNPREILRTEDGGMLIPEPEKVEDLRMEFDSGIPLEEAYEIQKAREEEFKRLKKLGYFD